MTMKPIGIIHSPFYRKETVPIQPSRSKAAGSVEVFQEYQEGLQDIEGFSHIVLIYRFHKSKGYNLRVVPYLDTQERGLFATRSPRRPNQIGLSIVTLVKRQENILFIQGLDVLDDTPLLDIKPFVPDFIPKGRIKIGWLQRKIR